MEQRIDIADHGVVWGFPARGKRVLELCGGAGEFFRLERVKCGKFGELSALPEKFRLHRTGDGCEAEVETDGVIPFGCEYRVARNCRITSGTAILTTDVSAVNFGRVDGVELEPAVFSGAWRSIEFMLFGEPAFRRVEAPQNGVVYAGAEVPLMIRVEFCSGMRAELALGADVWRHRGARRIAGAFSEYELHAAAGEIRFSRRVLAYAPEVEVERRPWRYTTLLGWDDGNSGVPPGGTSFGLAGCALSSAVRRELRRLVRHSSGTLIWRDAAPGICAASAHVARAGRGELEHFDLEELLADWRWANRQLRGSGAAMVVIPRADGAFADSVIMNRISGAMPELE